MISDSERREVAATMMAISVRGVRNFTLGAVLNSILTSGAPRPTTEMTTPAGCVEIASTERKASMSANGDVPPMALFWWALAFKYVWRLFAKGQGASDCAKARDCLARLADEMGRM